MHLYSSHVVKTTLTAAAVYTLRCGTATWGWKHIKAGHGWNNAMDKKISTAFWSGTPNDAGGFSIYTAQCPSVEKFRTVVGTPAGTNDLLTAYDVTSAAARTTKC